MFFKENKTLRSYFGVLKRSKNFFRRRKNKSMNKEKNSKKFFVILTFRRLFS